MKLLGITAIVALMTLASAASAEIKIGIIDMRTALFSSSSAKDFTDKMVSRYKQQDLEVRAIGEEGQKMELRLKNDSAIMSDSERNKLGSDLEAKIQEYKYLKGKLDKQLADERQTFLADSTPRLNKVINEVVEEEKLDLVMPSEAVLRANDTMDYTQKVVDRLNKLK